MIVPDWFDATAYFENKRETVRGLSRLMLKNAFESAGYSTDAEGLYRHFMDFGNAEGVSPNSWFNVDEYLYNKAADFYGTTSVTPRMAQSMRDAMRDAGMSPWDHYHLFWAESYASKGVFNNPSADFDVAAYMAAKLAQMQAAEPWAHWTMDSLVDAFVAAGLSPVEHYLAYGRSEGLVPTSDSSNHDDSGDDSGDDSSIPTNVYTGDSYAQMAGTETTITLPANANNICYDISTASLTNINNVPITELHGGFADDRFIISSDITSPLTIYGGGGSDSIVITKNVSIEESLRLVVGSSELSLEFADSVQVESEKLSIFFDDEGSDPLGFDVSSKASDGGLQFTFDSVPDDADGSLSITGTGNSDTFTLNGLSSLGSVSLDGGDGDDTLVIPTKDFTDIAVTLDMTQVRNIETIVIEGASYSATTPKPVTLDLSQTDAGVVLDADDGVYRPIYVTTHPEGSTLYLNGNSSNGNRITLTISQDPDTGEYIAADNLIQYFRTKTVSGASGDVMDLSRLGIGEAGDSVDFFATNEYTAGSFLNASGQDVLLLGQIGLSNEPEQNLQAVKNINWVNDPDLAGEANTILVDQTCLVIISEGTNTATHKPQPYKYCGTASFYLAVSDDSGVELVGLGSFYTGEGQDLSNLGVDNFSL